MKLRIAIVMTLSFLLITGCAANNPCPEGSVTYLDDVSQFPPDTSSEQVFEPVEMEIKGKTVMVDRVISGPLCNDTWEGTIYVSCDLELLKWDSKPFFLTNGCNLDIKEGTVVYVAAHNDAAYYKGCSSCH